MSSRISIQKVMMVPLTISLLVKVNSCWKLVSSVEFPPCIASDIVSKPVPATAVIDVVCYP